MIITINIDKCIILEYDAYLHINFKASVDKIIKIAHGDIVFYIMAKENIYLFIEIFRKDTVLPSTYHQAKRGIFSAAGYLLTKKELKFCYLKHMQLEFQLTILPECHN